ncbi:hypothetical protein B0H17DRAFT_1194647 [Mycena rosella]|uniref:Uncharacterized protein n=1 Tax=Mycena rosella TaxID=1033263 RepID=A0AAD7E1P4_MYCRO|nr:hypothetical protein B0H17DRAFT_1194647 [Mycena rosella]
MIFPSSLVLLALGLSASANPVPSRDAGEVAGQDIVFFQTLKVATNTISPGLNSTVAAEGPAGSAGSIAPLLIELTNLNTATTSLSTLSPGDTEAANQDVAIIVASILDGVNTALNKLIPKLGLDGLLTSVDGALTGLLTGPGEILPPVLALVGGMGVVQMNTWRESHLFLSLIPLGGFVGGLLSGLGLAAH